MKLRIAIALALAALLVWWFARHESGSAAVPLGLEREQVELPTPSSPLEAATPDKREETAPIAQSPATTPPPQDADSSEATLRARCLDEQGAPLAGVRLMGLGSRKPFALSAADGRIEASIPVEQAGGLKAHFELLDTFHVHVAFERVLKPGETCDLGDVVLKLGAAIRGSVVDENGKPVAQAWVTSSKKSLLPRRSQDEADSTNTSSLPDGSFLLEGVVLGTSCVTAFADKHEAGERTGLELVAGRELAGIVITLAPEQGPDDSGLLVRVLQPSGEPLAGASIETNLREGERSSMGFHSTDERGCFRVRSDPAGIVDIAVSDREQRYVSAFAIDVPVARKTLDIRLEEGSLHRLLVVDEHDVPVEEFASRVLYEAQYRPAHGGAMLRDTNGLLRDLFIGQGIAGPYAPRPQERKPHPGGARDASARGAAPSSCRSMPRGLHGARPAHSPCCRRRARSASCSSVCRASAGGSSRRASPSPARGSSSSRPARSSTWCSSTASRAVCSRSCRRRRSAPTTGASSCRCATRDATWSRRAARAWARPRAGR